MHVPSQPLMRPLLSQFLTSAEFSQIRRFFRVRKLCRLPGLASHSVYFGVGHGLI